MRVGKLFGTKDMTVGTPWQKLLLFAAPLLIGNVIQQIYSTVDAVVVGRFVGDEALAAVGGSFPIINLVFILFISIATGAGIMVAQYFGAKDRETLSQTIGTTLTLMAVASVIIMAAGSIITRPLLTLIKTPVNVIDGCTEYLTIIFIGISGIAYYNGVSGILRGMGDSVMPLVFLSITCFLNIVLDIWFVGGLGWGIAGAAWATVISQWVSSVLCIIRLARMKGTIDLNLKRLFPKKNLCAQLLKLGAPSAVTQVIFAFANILVQSLTNSFGSYIMTCGTIVMRVDGFAMMPNFTFGMAMSTFVGQNIGANKIDRVKAGVRSGLLMAVTFSTVMVILIIIFGKYLMGIFTTTQDVIDLSYKMLCILAVGYIAMSVTQTLGGSMSGAGDTTSPMFVSIFSTIIIRMPLAYLLAYLTRSRENPKGIPEIALYVSLLTAWILGACLAAVLFKRGRWRTKSVVKSADGQQVL
ncbi:MAG: MATE family efflux transporter [Clostridiales bacterium]|jgi:putative MATE family efflux protein|nr:MATE family efflux transporter [Clostridiales bacterium]